MWLTDRRAIRTLTVLSLATFVVFSLWPSLDLAVTGKFYDGRVFGIKVYPGVDTLRLALWDAAIAMFVFSLMMTIASALLRVPLMGLAGKAWGFITLTFVLGPGVLVNGLLKRHWGRARPADTTEFGGAARFTPPNQITDQCAANCSFVSGEVAGATALAIALMLILAANRARLPNWGFRLWQGIAIAIPLFTMWQRVAAGRHFLSDVLLAALFVALIAAVLAQVMRLR